MCEIDGRLVLRCRQTRIHIFCSYQFLMHCGLSCLFSQALQSLGHEIHEFDYLGSVDVAKLSYRSIDLVGCISSRMNTLSSGIIYLGLEKMNDASSPNLHIVCFHYHLGSRSLAPTIPGLGQPHHPLLFNHDMAGVQPQEGHQADGQTPCGSSSSQEA